MKVYVLVDDKLHTYDGYVSHEHGVGLIELNDMWALTDLWTGQIAYIGMKSEKIDTIARGTKRIMDDRSTPDYIKQVTHFMKIFDKEAI